jgi:hypothetical protein
MVTKLNLNAITKKKSNERLPLDRSDAAGAYDSGIGNYQTMKSQVNSGNGTAAYSGPSRRVECYNNLD